jgi:regulation of enolase protein 1 (concanavalin A-like superfamily)
MFTGSVSSDGVTWTQVGSQAITMNATIYVGLATCSHNKSSLCTATFDNVQIQNSGSYVFTGQDIGSVGVAGSNSSNGGVYTVSGSGADCWGTVDAFHYAYEQMTGNGTITARVTSQTNTDGWAKAGVMMRNSLNASDAHASTYVTPGNGMACQWRIGSGSNSGGATSSGGVPYWVRMTRAGNMFTGSVSSDGVTWTQVGSQAITMYSTIYVGLVTCSHNNSSLGTATFDNVSVGP